MAAGMRDAMVSAENAEQTAAAGRTHDLVSVQYLRGIAAMTVVMFHCFPQLERMGYTGKSFHSLSAGVDIFFVISGFIMLYSAHRSPERGAGDFLVNRAIRILPTYWILTAFMVAMSLLLPSLLRTTRFEPWNTAASFLMFPALHPVTREYQPILIPGWTLNCEVFFYLIFALGLWLLRDRGNGLALFTAAVIGGFALLPLVYPTQGPLEFYTNSLFIEFAYGLMAARLYIAGFRLPRIVGPMLMIAGAGLLLLNDYVAFPDIRGVFYGIPALMVFVGAVFQPQPLRRMASLRVLGDASYAIYLTHMITMSACGMAWRYIWGGDTLAGVLAFIMVSSAICAFGGIVFYRLVEAPVTEWLKGLRSRERRLALTPV